MTPTPLLALFLLAGSPPGAYVTVTASYVAPAKPGGNAHVAVTLTPRDPDVRVNEEPGPRLKLEADEAILLDKQAAPGRVVAYDPQTAKYLDPAVPFHVPVAVKTSAPRGKHMVAAKVTYYFCSKREGWCRKGTDDVDFAVEVK
jgi:hypothetical protein